MPKQCYCGPGFYGKYCELVSEISEKLSSVSSYNTVDLSSTMKLHWKVLDESAEIEIVVISKSKSWVAVGWRPDNITKECKSFWGDQESIVPRFRFRRDAVAPLSESQIKKFTPRGEFHEMDCTDIVIGSYYNMATQIS